MIKNVLDMLALEDFYGKSPRIDIAKGIYKIPYNFRELSKLIKRNWKSKK